MSVWRARVRRSGRVAVSLPSLRARRVALRSGPSGSVSDDMGGPSVAGGRGAGRGWPARRWWPRPAGGLGLAAGGGLGSGWPGGDLGGGCTVAGVAVAGGWGGGLGREAALVVAFEVELVLGVLGAGAPGAGQGLDGVQLGGAGGGLGVAFAGGVGA